jgi:hypothetical protein
MNGQRFLHIIDEAFVPFLKDLGFLMDTPSISGRFYRARFTDSKHLISVSFEPGDKFFLVSVFDYEHGLLSDIDDRSKTWCLADLNRRYMHTVTNEERSAYESIFNSVSAWDNEEKTLLKFAKELCLVLPKYLADFKANPTIMPDMVGQHREVIEAAQQSRIRHLEVEIKTFNDNIAQEREMNSETVRFHNRSITFVTPQFDRLDSIAVPFAALLLASNKVERLDAQRIAATLLDFGCSEFCCMGEEAKELHDFLDDLIEDLGRFEVVTTFHLDATEACEYFLYAAGGGIESLLAVILSHPYLVSKLKMMINENLSHPNVTIKGL